MLVSTIQNNEYGYVDLLSEVNGEEELTHFHQDLKDEKSTSERKTWDNGLDFDQYCNTLVDRYNSSNPDILTNRNFEAESKRNFIDESSKRAEIKQITRKLAIELEWDREENDNSVDMNIKNEYSFVGDDRPYPTRFSPEPIASHPIISYQECSGLSVGLYNDKNSYLDSVNSSKISSSPGLPTTSGNICKETKMHISADDDTNFDVFDFMKCSDDEVTDCSKSYCDKSDLTLNDDLVNKYEKNLGLDIVKDKNICWAAGNFESEVCPLKNYEVCNENSLMNFTKGSLDGESRESFSQEWDFDENIDYVSQEQVPDPHIIVPKKAVDITKIKGWRKKQFTVEKCLANKNSLLKKSNMNSDATQKAPEGGVENEMKRDDVEGEEQNKDYAFVYDKLDDFLDQEAELKINYEIPHLYAEYGIKLTSEELVSRPKFKLSAVCNRLPISRTSQNILPQKPTNVPCVYSERTGTEEKQSTKTLWIKKLNPTTKCAFPNKSHKNWNLWKENNLSKGKPMSLLKKALSLKRENLTEISSPCRRSGRISQITLNKSSISANPAFNERKSRFNSRGCVEAVDDNLTLRTVSKPIIDFGTEYNFQIRKFGVVLYPGPSAPLNPFITYHLQKIRSYRTVIDRKWANFAVSVVVQKGKTENRKRMILPVTCCFKYKNETSTVLEEENHCKVETESLDENSPSNKESTLDVEVNVNDKKFAVERRENISRQNSGQIYKKEISESSDENGILSAKKRRSVNRLSVDSALTKKINEGKFDLYEEEITCGDNLKNEIDMVNATSYNNGLDNMKEFSDYSNLYSDECDIVFEKRKQKTSISNCIKENSRNTPEVIDIEDDETNANHTGFNKVIAKLLTKKLNENVTSSIDNLKTVKRNALELIKLNFIKENYLTGYINLWYVKSRENGKSRVFLTFSMSPPAEGAINLKMMSRCSESDPPNIVQEIMTKDKVFDSNDLAILCCNGKHWEIHGSVNFATDKSYSQIEGNDKIQVFHLTKKVFPELELLHDIKQRNDKNKVLKWWVMHMMQDYTEITVKCGDKVGRISRSIIIKTWKRKVPSFIEFKGLDNVRPIGVGVNPRLWPYFLIGPYYMGDNHNLTLKLNSKIVPFEYYLPLDRVKPAFLLKRFVSSVIMHSWRNCRQVVGMWLYDRIATKQSSFIQVRTRVKKSGGYEPSKEHDYSLTKTPDGLFESKMEHNLPSKRVPVQKTSQPTQEVFLVSDVPHLGYIKGELHLDKSITIEHPLKPDRKRNSHRIGDWLNRIMRKRIKFYPNDFYVKWKIVKNADLIRDLQPLDRSSLGGTHILCKKGIFYLLSLTKDKISKLGLDESVIIDAILNNPIIQEVVEVKELGKILLKKDSCDLPISDVLQMALCEIEKLEKEDISLRKSRIAIEEERTSLCHKFLKALDTCQIDENSKRTIDFYITGILESIKKNEEIIPDSKREKENLRRLKAINKFLQNVEFFTCQKNSEVTESSVKATKAAEEAPADKPSNEQPSKDKPEENAIEEEKFEEDNEKVRELEWKIKTLHESLNKMTGDDGSLREMLTERLNTMSQHLEKMKRTHNINGKLSPVLGGLVSSAAEQSHCQGSARFNDTIENENRNITCIKKTEEFDPIPPSLHADSYREKDRSLEFTGERSKTEENNNVSSSGLKSNTYSVVGLAKRKPGFVKIMSEKCSLPSKVYVTERRSTDENHRNSLSENEGTWSNFSSNKVEEITFDVPEADKTAKCNGFENLARLTNDNGQNTPQLVKNNGLQAEEIPQGRRLVVGGKVRLKTWRNPLKYTEGKIYGNMGKRVRFKFLKPNSLSDGKASEKFNGRIEYLDGKKILFLNKKRKRDGRNEFLKKMRTS